jgi:UDP-N-acetylglucosamine 4,6-dehydratase/5-epimerase
VVHAAATKIVPTAEYNPFECVKTNVNGAMNLIDACIDKGVKRVVALSTDKASSPINLYGATKLASDKLFVAGNSYAGGHDTRFAVVRYGNVMGSRGSVIPFFMSIRDKGVLPITDDRMTRFMISLEQGVELVWHAFDDMEGGEIYVKKIPSMKVTDLARVIAPEAKQEMVGIRPGEKLHEQMIGAEDSFYTYEYPEHFKILPAINNWDGTPTASRTARRCRRASLHQRQQPEWMNDELQAWIDANWEKIGASDDPLRPPRDHPSRYRRRGRGASLRLPHPGTHGASLRGNRGRVWRAARRGRQQRHLGPAHRLPGARAWPRRPALDQPDHLRGLRQLRPVLRRRGRFRRYRPAHLQSLPKALERKLVEAERKGACRRS